MSTPSQPLTGAQPSQPSQQLLMIAPTGEAAYVPQEQVPDYESKGGKIGVRMTAPDGNQKAIVPFDQQDTYQKQGATWDSHPDNDAAKAFLTQRSVAQSRSQTPGKALVTGPDGGMMYMDVPPGHEASTEQANQKGTVTGAVTGAGMLATAATAGLAAELAAPGVITEEAATGLLDEFGEPITRQIVKEGPSILGKGFQIATKWVQAHPTTARAVIETAGVAVGMKVLGKMAKLAEEFGGK
jgi:hypothetical protein